MNQSRGTTALWLAAGGYATWRILTRFRLRGASVVISGSRGLGLELAREFGARHARITLLARDEAELAAARNDLLERGVDVLTYACDIGDPEQVRQAVRWIRETSGVVDVLVNNAGVIQVGPVEHMTQADFEEAMAVHAWGPLYLVREIAPLMKAQGRGRIVNISSIGGLVAVPHLLPYVMSKFALTGLSDGLRAELARYGIRVTTICPGLMRTGSHVNAYFKGQQRKEFAWFSLAGSSPLLSMSSRRAARRIVRACVRGEARVITTSQARLLFLMNALAPGATAAALRVATRFLPGPSAADGDERRPGWASQSTLAPSFLTRLADRASVRNNEFPTAVAEESPTR